ncbi:ABC transporter substrate-binding protein [Gammaproteobacteria bacterium 45_16_T64]|nr:ABC transporter substrate-binding protein [Gammaproteobacteria bacterium 45_16_T64]
MVAQGLGGARKLLVGFVAILICSHSAFADMKAAERWVDEEFKDSTLTRAQQLDEMKWFVNAGKPFQNITVRVVSERIDTHVYEANVLTKAFEDITGIKVIHEITGEDDVVKKIATQMSLPYSIYDAYINDSDLIGTHYRYGQVVALSDFMKGEGKDVTLPTLDLKDFIGISFTSGPDGKLYQLPDQQFANLYWYRHDWFSRPELQKKFKGIYGYDLAVPVNWSAYEDIAEFFTVHVGELDGQTIYGHMDYGRKDPSLGWRFSDAWLSMAGAGDKGIPNGLPVDEWGIRVENCSPVGASVARGGALNSPASVYAITKFVEWLEKYAPPGAKAMNFSQAGAVPGQGNIAQQIFWYTAFTAALTNPDLPVVNADGSPKWRMAPSPRGPYWEKGMKLGYQDAGAWTLLKNTPLDRKKAAWLYAQFVVSKTVSLRKTLVGLTPIRDSDIQSAKMAEVAHKYGGLMEFYRSKAREIWSPTGTNVPDYPKLSDLWWKNVALAANNNLTPKQAMDKMAGEMDDRLQALADAGQERCTPKLNPKKDPQYWLDQPGSPKQKLANEKPKGKTVSYDDSLKAWD